MTLTDVLSMHQTATERNDLETLQKVERAYLQILEEDPHNPQMLQLLGTLYIQINKVPLGVQVLERCVSIDPNISEAWNNLGNAYRSDHHVQDAERCYKEAVRCAPENGENYNNWGTNYVNEGRPAEGEAILRNAVKYAPENPHGWWNLALVLLEQGKYEEGFQYYKYGMQAKIRHERFYGCPEWDGKETDHLILYAEQGIGDEIMYMSIVPLIKNVKKISIDCHLRLIGMFQRSFPGIDFYPTRKERQISWHTDQNFTARCALGDLPKYFIKTWQDFNRTPYIKPRKEKQVNKRPIIGLSWEGGRKKTRNDLRSLSLADFLPLIQSVDADFVSLQYTTTAKEQVEAFNKKYGVNVLHRKEVHEFDYDNTLDVLSDVDLVVTVNTSLVHLCGAAGINAFVLTPKGKAWRYYSPDGSHMAMYGDHIRLFEQGNHKEWKPVIERVVDELNNRKT